MPVPTVFRPHATKGRYSAFFSAVFKVCSVFNEAKWAAVRLHDIESKALHRREVGRPPCSREQGKEQATSEVLVQEAA